MINDFNYEKMEVKIKVKINDMYLIEIKHREFRRSSSMFFSKISEYNQLGFVFNNSFHLLKKYMKCINCYSNYENNEKCTYCNYEFSECKNCFFLNSRSIMPTNTYKNLRKKYNLNTLNERYYDQRHKMSTHTKEELIAKALHPDRIEKIIALSKDSWINIGKYI